MSSIQIISPETETKEELIQLVELLDSQINDLKYNKLKTLFPLEGPFSRVEYQKAWAFMQAGKLYNQRANISANRTGKTLTGATELAYHLTGLYPVGWDGRVFTNSVDCWAAGITNQSTRDIQQKELLGELNDIGTGTIPKHCLGKITKKPGAADAIESIEVKHHLNGKWDGTWSRATFKSYEQRWESFQGTYRHVIWLDEDPELDPKIYPECLMRTMNSISPGMIIFTGTPLQGMSTVVKDFLPNLTFPDKGVDPSNPYKYVVNVTWDEVPHLSPEQKEEMMKSIPAHERDVRTKGIPSLGSGAIYPFAEEAVTCTPFEIPEYWPRGYGLDVGWNKTAAVWGAQNPDTKEIFIYAEYYIGGEQPVIHAHAIKQRGSWVYGAIDPASMGKSQVDGRALFNLYEESGLNLVMADNSVEVGIMKIFEGFSSGQIKIFTTCTNLLKERRTYCRKDDGTGKIKEKQDDHALDALRYFIMTGIDYMTCKPDPDAVTYSQYRNERDKHTGY
jgi:phage terminase large subunit-like protein